jgi:heptosyltransferase-2
MNPSGGAEVKPRLLIVELWGLGDLVIATPFMRAAVQRYAVTLLAKPFAAEMRPHLWPEVNVISFVAPWTAFRFGSKYALWRWPWPKILSLATELRARKFDCAVSGRWDPRDHLLLQATGARRRLGFPRLQSGRCLTESLPPPDPLAHRSEYWRVIAGALGLSLPPREGIAPPARPPGTTAFIHSGARLPARVWPLANFRGLARRLRQENIPVQIACDPNQVDWWRQQGEPVACPRNVEELFGLLPGAGIFIGNCSGPGHLAAISGVPTFTIYGPSLPEWWAPLHPAAEWIEGKACPYKPCSDYCRYPTPDCLWKISEEEAWGRIKMFARRHLSNAGARLVCD